MRIERILFYIAVTVCIAGRLDPAYAVPVYIYGGDFSLPIPQDAGDTKGWMEDAVIEIGEHRTIYDLDLLVNITHSNAFDLQLYLQSPAGTRICLNSYGINEFFKGENYTQTIFDDEAAFSIKEGQAPFTGRFRPMEPYQLSAFDGEDIFGIWKLQVYDAFYADRGTLNHFELIISVPEPSSLIQFAICLLFIPTLRLRQKGQAC